MYLNAHIEVRINGIVIPYITAVDTKDDSTHLGSTCEITMPLNARIRYQTEKKDENGEATGIVETLTEVPMNLFQTGDAITVKAKYDGYEKVVGADPNGWLDIFEGYLYDFYQGLPLKIKCLDSVYLANQGTYTKSYKKVTLKDLIKDIIAGTELTLIDVEKTYIDADGNNVENSLFGLELENITFKDMSPSACLEWLRKELGIMITLIGKKVYYNIASNTLETVDLNTKANIIKANLETTNLTNIKHSVTGISKKGNNTASIFQKYKIKAWFIQADGTKDSIEVGDTDGQLREVFYYKISRESTDAKTIAKYKELATQALIKVRQSKFSGTVETLLYPYCDIFWRVKYTDASYPQRNGFYVVTEKSYKLNENGFRQTLKLAYLMDVI